MTYALNGLPWKAEPDPYSHKGWRIVKTTAHYSDGIAASYMSEQDAKVVCETVNAMYGENAEDFKQRLYDFIKNDIMPLVAQQSGEDSERYRLAKMAYFVLRNRTVENWGPQELTMDVAMRLP